MRTLKHTLSAWDGKQTDVLGDIYSELSTETDFMDACVALLHDSELQVAASWLIKKHCDLKRHVNAQQVAGIFGALQYLQHWQAKLHILQSLSQLPVAKQQQQSVHTFISNAINDENKFVRAWAYDGLYQLARQHPEYEPEARDFFDMAMRDEAASVKARIRNILKQWH